MNVCLVHGDAVDVLRHAYLIPTPRPSLIITDPPFNVSNDRNRQNDFNGYTSNKGDWDGCVDIAWVNYSFDWLADNGLFACFGVFGSLVPVYIELESKKAIFQSHIMYGKTNPAPSVQHRMYTHANEIILVYSKGVGWTYNYLEAKKLADKKQLKNVWHAPVVRRILGRTIKHESVLDKLILPLSNPNDWVLDPFCGACSIGLRCVALGRNYIGIDNDSSVLDYAVNQFVKLGVMPEVYDYESGR